MKFLTLEQGQLGALLNESVIDLERAGAAMRSPLPWKSLLELILADEESPFQAWRLAEAALEKGFGVRPYAEVSPQAPLPRPVRNIFCLGKNFLDHAREIKGKVDKGAEIPSAPIFFTKATTSVCGPGDTIPAYRHLTQKLDYEAELAVIIGKGGRDISREQAMDHVFGYTAMNDISARDLQSGHLQWFKGKSLDGFAPLGPVVVHRSVMPPPVEIEVRAWVNDELRQSATLDKLIFDIPEIVATLSAGMTLVPGDIIATGTPAGVGMGFDPPRYLKPGDEVVVEINGAGRLANRIGE